VSESEKKEAPRDLRQVGAPESESDQATTKPDDVPYDPAADRESVRGQIAMWLVVTLVLLVLAVAVIGVVTAVLCGSSGKCSADTVELKSVRAIVELILTPLVGLVGAVTGFYFGEKSRGAVPRNGNG
jgi:hypothetical protein